jgi:transposase
MNTTPPFIPELWEQTPLAVREYIRTLEARVAALEATVQQLLERLHQDSHNSSRPPSSDPPRAMPQRPRRGPSGRKRGGQPGHAGQSRALVPVEEVATVIPVKPQQCHRCQHPLQGDDPQPYRHQVTEVPPIKPVVTEYQLHRLRCPACTAVLVYDEATDSWTIQPLEQLADAP